MDFCIEENGMSQPLTITSNQVQFDSPPTQSTGINPTPTTPGLTFTTPKPQINVTLDQSTILTVIYLPVDRPNNPSNVQDFAVVFVYPNGTTSTSYTSTTPSTSSPTTTTTSTPSAGTPQPTSTTPSPAAIVPLSDVSPRVDLPPNFKVPETTTVVILITSTTNGENPTGVRQHFFTFLALKSRSHISYFWKKILNGTRETRNIHRHKSIFKVKSTL
jgi:hypothetical protein